MELPRTRAFGTQGKKPTNDFLSLYGHSAFPHQDPRPPQGMYLKTHDFLQPLERVGKNKNGENLVETSSEEKPSPPPPPPSIEHVLPGGIGTYSISHISHFNQQVPKPDTPVYIASHTSSTERNGEANGASSNCSSYSGGAFTLWEESFVKEKDTIMNDTASERHAIRELAEKLGQRSSDRPSQTSFSNHNSFSSLASSKQMGQKNKSFLEMMKSAKGLQEDEDDDEEEFVLKKEGSSNKVDVGNLTVKVDGKSTDQKANTPRSKHSATEQRRRSKINDRFQVLRELIPHSDQKRDKASFLLEVIEYIQFLQEKVQKYETSYQGWNQETPKKLMPWRNSHGHVESMIDHSRVVKNGPGPGLMLARKFDDSNIAVTPIMLANAQTTVEPDLSTGAACKAVDHHSTLNKAVPLPIHLQPNMFSPTVRGSGLAQPPQRPPQEDNLVSMAQSQSQFWQNRACRTEFPIASDNTVNEQEELIIERGTINISSAYSQGLLNSLTQALQSSGLDLSEASISVQIHLGKRAINRPTTTSNPKDQEDPSSSNRAVAQHSRVASGGDNSDQACKRLKTEKS